MAYRILHRTADIALDLSAPRPDGLYATGCAALTDCLTSRAQVQESIARQFKLKAADSELLLVAWLETLLEAFRVDRVVFFRAVVTLRPAGAAMALEGEAFGEPFDEARHGIKTEVKAVTYHELRIWEEEDAWRARVVLDI